MPFQSTSLPFLVKSYPGMVCTHIHKNWKCWWDASSKTKKELQAFLGIIHYLSKFSPNTANLCESLRQLTMSKTERTWNVTYQKLFDKAKSIIKENACTKFYNETQPLYLETDVSGVRLVVSLLKTRSGTSCPRDKASDNSILRPIMFASESLSSVERRYSNIEREVLGIQHTQEIPSLLLCERGE